jgi:hypothetical protein
MAPAKTVKKAPPKSRATQAKGKEKATQAKKKEIAASTAALQAAKKKKNQLRKDSGLGMSYLELNDSPRCLDVFFLYPGSRTALANTNSPPEASGAGGDSTPAAVSAAEEIKQLRGQFFWPS